MPVTRAKRIVSSFEDIGALSELGIGKHIYMELMYVVFLVSTPCIWWNHTYSLRVK